MSKILEFLRSHHIQLALAAGFSILALGYASRHLLAEPMGKLPRAFPPFLAVIAEGVITQYRGARIATTWYWIAAILGSTALVIWLHLT